MRHEETIRAVIHEVRIYFGVPFPAECKRRRRTRNMCRARATTALILRRVTDMTLEEIAGCVGYSHGAMGNATRRAFEELWVDEKLRSFVERVVREIKQ